ncbi:hypothetical protein SBFV3_gp06 [Sulfolobales Beppu filamentous virus 3]|uniref:Uncharacterized protein n=1 Tax=Sulfolobales Beppu filamentous virus 3 TaxID=2493124 RepID=A0A3S8NF35_9VIRU|nr:hypothetical protein HOU83_gp06 [Sulfolobales Beppu filamentous virus 3]AZI75841.1 hypothetical protein SBFV3_gp06 [Sulfolobales Beppu filamentous virus 3]
MNILSFSVNIFKINNAIYIDINREDLKYKFYSVKVLFNFNERKITVTTTNKKSIIYSDLNVDAETFDKLAKMLSDIDTPHDVIVFLNEIRSKFKRNTRQEIIIRKAIAYIDAISSLR